MPEEGEDSFETNMPLLSDEIDDQGDDALSRSGNEQLTNRRKVLARNADLESVAEEDVVMPRGEPRLVVMAAGAGVQVGEDGQDEGTEASETTSGDLAVEKSAYSSTSGCEPVIGISYKDSTPCPEVAVQPPKGAPNVVFIVLDDVGFGQIGCFGGPIETPNIDRLAAGGLRYNNFHTTAMCSPTRACLLTGRNHHSVGIGAVMELPAGYPGYSMTLSKNAATLPEILLENGFNTFAVGKWHLSEHFNAGGPFDNWPTGRGFEKYYGFIGSETNQWYPDLVSGTTRVDLPKSPEEGYHISEDLVDHAIGFINSQQAAEPDHPYFMYLSFGACHAPHHAPQEYIDMYKGRFDEGWDAVRNETLARQKASGIVPEDTELPPRNPDIPAWEELNEDQQMVFAREQEVYAGVLTHTDAQIGRFLDHLEEAGQLNGTMIILVSDNGASREGGFNSTSNNYLYFNRINENLTSILAHIDELGGTTTWNHYAEGWAMAGNTP
ncbi:MAG TPA: arylsulfatase, partial [Methanothrix sp.]|nr:arylsulfatase [Methanothrix sp.]